jgi:thiol-disulfide isomerase/thioredoxin
MWKAESVSVVLAYPVGRAILLGIAMGLAKRFVHAVFLAMLLGVAALSHAAGDGGTRLSGFLTDGTPFDLVDQRGKVVMVNFWATWCPACRADWPVWQEVYERYQGSDFEMVAVSIDRDKKALDRFLERYTYTVPVVWRFDSREKDGFPAIRKTPTTYFIGRDGQIAGVRLGRISPHRLTETIEALLQP